MVLLSVMACVSLMLAQEIPEQTISIDTIIEASPDTVQLDQIIQYQQEILKLIRDESELESLQ